MKLLFDTSVVLDVLLDREPHAGVAERLVSLVDADVVEGVLCADSLTTIDYVAARKHGLQTRRRLLDELLRVFMIVPVDRAVLEAALRLDVPHFEDAVVHEAAKACGADGIVTRDAAGFSRGTLPVLEPVELLSVLSVA